MHEESLRTHSELLIVNNLLKYQRVVCNRFTAKVRKAQKIFKPLRLCHLIILMR